MSKEKDVPSEAPKNIPPIETDGKHCYVLDKKVKIGSAYVALQKRREIHEKEYTLDAHTLEVLRSLVEGVNLKAPTLLEGPTAGSKTSAIEYLALMTGHQYHRINLKGQTDSSELLGKFVPNPDAKPGEAPLMWQDGLLVKAMKEGHWVILDELNLAEPQILEAINSVLEKYPSITLTDNGGVKIGPGGDFEVHSDFRIFGTMNPGYTGRQPLSPAFQNRWTNRVAVSAPTKDQLEAMLNHHSFGEQPAVKFQGETYQSKSGSVPDQMARLQSLAKKTMKAFFNRLASFHEQISQMAEKQDIGRDLDPGHLFTRRDLGTFLEYIAVAESVSRHHHQTRTLETHPAMIIWEGIRLVYLNKIQNTDDRKKVEALLKASKLDEKTIEQLFTAKEKGIIEETRGMVEGIKMPDIKLVPEANEVQEQLEKDYQRSVETLQFYDLIQEKSDAPGTYGYKADYDGTGEGTPGENISGQEFTMPSLAETMATLSADQIKLYKEMKDQGLEPQLQLTPIALQIRTMGQKIDAKRDELEINTRDTYVWDQIRDHELIYDAEEWKAIDGGKKLQITGGVSKSTWIKNNKGWVIDIVATKQEISADEDKKTKTVKGADGKSKEVELKNAEKTEKYMEDAKNRGYCGLGYETYLTAQMDALRRKKPLEESTFTLLPGSSLKNLAVIAVGICLVDRVHLRGNVADLQDDNLRFRRSVRGKRLGV